MQDNKRAFPTGPPPSQGGDALRNAREVRAVGGAGAGAGGSPAPGFPALPGAAGEVRRRGMGPAPLRHPLTPVRTWWTRLADAGSLAALCGIVCGGPLLIGMVWLPWAKYGIMTKYTAQFRDGLPYAWHGQLPDPAQGQDGATELNNCRIQLHERSIFTPPSPHDARTLTDDMGAVP